MLWFMNLHHTLFIDYILCHESLLSKVKYVMVHELTPHSIHCLVSCHIQTGRSVTNDTSVTQRLT